MSELIYLEDLTSEDVLAHYGVKGMKWGKRSGSVSSTKEGRAKARREVYKEAGEYAKAHPKSTVGLGVVGGLATGGALTMVAGSSMMLRSAGYKRGTSVALGILAGPLAAVPAMEIAARKRAKAEANS